MEDKRPIVTFDVSKVFHRYFVYHTSPSNEDIENVKVCKNIIEETFKKKERSIIDSIQEILGPTTEKELRVWIVDDKMRAPSISKPLLLKCKGNTNLMLYTLVHELAHRYLDAGDRWKGKKSEWLEPGLKLESLCHYVAEKVLGSEFIESLNADIGEIGGYDDAKAFISKNEDKIKEFLVIGSDTGVPRQ